uniref:Uncharacterized protein n=1 Tax=Timema genevievae TaxID=629358 RepID=A0A7R9K1N6_TIMGE|nr:unnamed protein product [Timema genevievae]
MISPSYEQMSFMTETFEEVAVPHSHPSFLLDTLSERLMIERSERPGPGNIVPSVKVSSRPSILHTAEIDSPSRPPSLPYTVLREFNSTSQQTHCPMRRSSDTLSYVTEFRHIVLCDGQDGHTQPDADLDEEMEKVFTMPDDEKFDLAKFGTSPDSSSGRSFGEKDFNSHRKNSFPHMHKSIHSRSMKKRDPSPRGSESERSDGGTWTDVNPDWLAQAPDSRKLSTLEIESDTGQKEVPAASTSNVDNLPSLPSTVVATTRRTFPSSSPDLAPRSDIPNHQTLPALHHDTSSRRSAPYSSFVTPSPPSQRSPLSKGTLSHPNLISQHPPASSIHRQKDKLACRHQQEDEAIRPAPT